MIIVTILTRELAAFAQELPTHGNFVVHFPVLHLIVQCFVVVSTFKTCMTTLRVFSMIVTASLAIRTDFQVPTSFESSMGFPNLLSKVNLVDKVFLTVIAGVCLTGRPVARCLPAPLPSLPTRAGRGRLFRLCSSPHITMCFLLVNH